MRTLWLPIVCLRYAAALAGRANGVVWSFGTQTLRPEAMMRQPRRYYTDAKQMDEFTAKLKEGIEDFTKQAKLSAELFAGLKKIPNEVDALPQKWQATLQVSLAVQVHVIPKYGFSRDDVGISKFNVQVAKAAREFPELIDAYGLYFRTLSQIVFNYYPPHLLSFGKAKAVAEDIENFVISTSVMNKLYAASRSHNETADRANAVMPIIVEQQMRALRSLKMDNLEGWLTYVCTMSTLSIADPVYAHEAQRKQQELWARLLGTSITRKAT